jgi:hypothetical protein
MALDLIGQRFGRLVVKSKTNPGYGSRLQSEWICDCDCGGTINVPTGRLTIGKTSSCGCLQRESRSIHSGKAQITHGMTNTPEYRSWSSMNSRCSNPKDSNYPAYGGRGITVCDQWSNSFEIFYHDMGLKPTPEHSIDRKENDKGYYKENCRWATRTEQQNNRECNRYYNFNNEQLTLPEIARLLNINVETLRSRLNRGMSEERAFSSNLFYDK